jgi:hypothetical protein
MSTVYWKMRNGNLIDVDDMDINHLRNTLKMIIKASQAQVRSSQIANKSSFEGDMAQQFNESLHEEEYLEF